MYFFTNPWILLVVAAGTKCFSFQGNELASDHSRIDKSLRPHTFSLRCSTFPPFWVKATAHPCCPSKEPPALLIPKARGSLVGTECRVAPDLVSLHSGAAALGGGREAWCSCWETPSLLILVTQARPGAGTSACTPTTALLKSLRYSFFPILTTFVLACEASVWAKEGALGRRSSPRLPREQLSMITHVVPAFHLYRSLL